MANTTSVADTTTVPPAVSTLTAALTSAAAAVKTTLLRGSTQSPGPAGTTDPCLSEACIGSAVGDFTVEAVAGGLAFTVLVGFLVFALVCNDRVTKKIRAHALSDTQSALLARFVTDAGRSIELTTFQKESKLQFVLSHLHYRSIMAPRQVLSRTAPWQQPAPGSGVGSTAVASAASAALSGMNIRKTQLARENTQLFCNLLCKQVAAAPANSSGLGVANLTIVHCEESPATAEAQNAAVRKQLWCAYFGLAERSRTGLEKYEMQTAIAKTLRAEKDLIAFDVARCSFPGVDDAEGRAKLDTVLRAWVQLCNAQLDTSGAHDNGGGSGGVGDAGAGDGGGGGAGGARGKVAASSFNTENDGRSGGIGMVYKQSLAAVAAPLLVVAGGDEVVATGFLWNLTRRHKGLYQSLEEPPASPGGAASPGSPGGQQQQQQLQQSMRPTAPPPFQEFNLVQQMHYTASLLLFWDPALAQRLFVELSVHPSMFMVPWLEAFFAELFPPEDLVLVLDFVVSLGCYDCRASAYVAAAVLISLRGQLMDPDAMAQDWQALQFFSQLNGGEVAVDVAQVRALACQICQCTPASLAPRPVDEEADLTMGQLVPIMRSLDEVQELGREHACVLHIVFRDASKGPLLLGQMAQLSTRLLPPELAHLPVFALDSAEILRDGVLAATDLGSKNKATHAKLRQAFARLLVRKCRGIMGYKGRMVLIFVDQQPVTARSSGAGGGAKAVGFGGVIDDADGDRSAASQKRHLAQRVCVLLSRCYFPNACMVLPSARALSSAAARYAAAVEEREAASKDVGQFINGGSSRVSMRVSKSESVFLESVEMGGIHYMRLGDGKDDEDEDEEEEDEDGGADAGDN